jgi:hypothetical protein
MGNGSHTQQRRLIALMNSCVGWAKQSEICTRGWREFSLRNVGPSKKKQDNGLKSPWSESASELYRPSDRRFSAKLVPTFAVRGCHVISVTDPYDRIIGFLDRIRYFSIK